MKFGVIHFAVSIKVSPGFKESVFKIKESQWHLLFDKEESTLLTAQEWAEVCYVPEWVSKKKGNADYRFIARDTMENLSDHPAASSSMTFISKFCSVGLAIYDDRMGIFNDGGLLLGVTVAQIKKGFSKLSNPLIADVLYKCNLIEKWGRGIQEMIHSCQDAAHPESDFFTDELEFTVQFPFPHNISPPVGIMTPDVKITKRQQEILTILQKAGELSLSEIAVDITDKPSDRMLRKDMNHLKELGLVGAKGITRGTIWFISNK